MRSLNIYFRIRQRQNSDPADYFRDMREKYPEMMFGPICTIYLSVSPQDVPKLRRDQFLIADTSNGPAMVIKEMIGNLDVASEGEARALSENLDDHVLAEFVVKIFPNRGPV